MSHQELNYEQGINEQVIGREDNYSSFAAIPMLAYRSLGIKVIDDIDIWQSKWIGETYQYFYFAVDKMRGFAKVRDENGKLVADKARIIYNDHIAIIIDKASQIKNDPNDWSREHEQPRYILDMLLSVIMLSCQTVDIVNTLPILKF